MKQAPGGATMTRREELAEGIVGHLLNLLRYQHRFSHRLRKEYGLSGRRLAMLRRLVEVGPVTVGEASRYLHVCYSAASSLLDRMEDDGWVERHRCPEDNRKVQVTPTEKGREVVERAPRGLFGSLRLQLPELSIEELEGLQKAMQRLTELGVSDESLL